LIGDDKPYVPSAEHYHAPAGKDAVQVHHGLRRAGVPILTGHTIVRAAGRGGVEEVLIAALGKEGPLPETEQAISADTLCLAVGLSPMTELAWMAGCKFTYIPLSGGHVPLHNADMETTVKDIYVAGDITGIEEAATAMEEGSLAGIAAAASLGFLSAEAADRKKANVYERLENLRSGQFGQGRRESKEKQLAAMAAYLAAVPEREAC
jgi:pyruvate/2-oxoglutarate dehydrogenase complex dihydrolipoamide dehydrogenase (E3) component